MIATMDNFTQKIIDNLKSATTIFLAIARMEETQKTTLSVISSRLDAEAAGSTEKLDNIKPNEF